MRRPEHEHPFREALRGISLMTLLAVTTGVAAALIAVLILAVVEAP